MLWRRKLVCATIGGIVLTVAASWLLATRALDTPRAGRTADNANPAQWIDVSRYDRFGSIDVRCLASTNAWGTNRSRQNLTPDQLAPPWMRPMLIPWGWTTAHPAGAFSVRTVKISGWPLPCLYSIYEAVPSPGTWPHRAISGIVVSDSWTGFGVQYLGEMPVALPYRPRWIPFVINSIFYGAIIAGLCMLVPEWRRRSRRNRGRCVACNYDVRGLSPDAPCPECGAASTQPQIHPGPPVS